MLRFSRSAAGVSIAVLATSAVAPPAIAAAQAPPAPEYQAQGLLDDLLGNLGDVLNGLLGGTQQDQLRQLLGLLQGGTDPTSDVLAPLTDILGQLGRAQGLPGQTRDLITQLTALLNSGRAGVPLDPSLLAPVADLLRQLAGLDGLPAPVPGLLTGLADALTGGDPAAGLPVDGALNLLPETINGLNRVLDGLLGGDGQPTGELLAPLIPLLQQVADADGLPPALRDLINQLIDTLQSTTGALDPLLTSTLSTVLTMVGNTPGVDSTTRTIIERTTTILDRSTTPGVGGPGGPGGPGGTGGSGTGTPGSGAGPGGGTGGTGLNIRRLATARDRAVIKRVTVNRKKTIASVRIACPKTAPAVCSTTLRAAVSGKSSKAKRIRIGQGKSKVAKLQLTKAATRQLKRRGGKIAVNLTTAFGTQRFGSKTTLRVRRAR